MRERNSRVNSMLGEYVKGNSRVQLVNIDTGFVQVRVIVFTALLLPPNTYFDCQMLNLINCFQVDGTISHHDMFDYVTLTQKGYTKAFEPVNELLTTLLQEMEGEVRR